MLHPHSVSMEDFDALAGGPGQAAIVDRLKQAGRSRQLILLRAVLDRASALAPDIGPLPAMETAWQLLVAAQRHDHQAAEQVITCPQVGLWAAKALRRLKNLTSSDTPLWADLGYLHLVAAAAAIRAAFDFHTRVPVWNGSVFLPTLGLARLPGHRRWDIADVHGERSQVRLRGSSGSATLPRALDKDGESWQALWRLETGHGKARLGVRLDDLDPYRGFDEPLPPSRITSTEAVVWQESLDAAWRLLSRHHPAIAEELSAGLKTLVPQTGTGRFKAFSASNADAFGCVVLSLPPDPMSFAATLVHEFQHSKLGILLDLFPLTDPRVTEDPARFYAPWRDDPRPLNGLLHGVYSFLGVTAFYRAQRLRDKEPGARTAQYEFAYRREQTTRAATTLAAVPELTRLGRRFTATMLEQLAEWNTDAVPADLLTAVRRTSADHYATWRLRHYLVEPDQADELARAWLRNRKPPEIRLPQPKLRDDIDPAPGPSARGDLTRVWLGDPDLFRSYLAAPELAIADIPGATTADLALISGDTEAAARGYRARLAVEPDDLASWIGLALTVPGGPFTRPELVRAVQKRITARSGTVADPLRLGDWLALVR